VKKVAVIHTSFVSVDTLKDLFREILPDVQMINIVDDSLLPEVMANGSITNDIVRRISAYALQAEALGASAILNQCSSVGEAVDVVRNIINIPYVKVDESMAEEAVNLGERISVIGTVKSTMNPSARLIEKTADKLNKNVIVRQCLVEGALDVLMKEGDKEKHNSMVLKVIENVEKESDVIVLAQGSMTVLLPQLKHIQRPVLTSPRSGVTRIKHVLEL
jgi:Asp/Glu/hydantoin racemase